MCENVLQQSHLENGDNTFADPIWNCLDNPLQTRRMLKNRINSNKKLLPFEAKPKPEVYKQPKVSLGLNLQPSKNRKESRPSLEIQHKNKKPRLDFTTQINETITQSDFRPQVASTPAVFNTAERNRAQSPLELDVENLSPKASEIPIKVGGCPGTPPRTPKRRSSINPLAKKAIIQNAEQYTPGKQAKTPPQSIHELDERLKSLNRKTKSILNSPLKNGPKEEEHQFLEQEAIEEQHVDQGVNEDQHLNQGVKTVSIIEVLDSSDENNEEIPDTQHPKSISEGGQLDEERGKTEEDNHESHSDNEEIPETQETPDNRSIPNVNITIPETQQLNLELSPQEEENCSQKNESSQVILDLRLRRSQSVPKAIDLRMTRHSQSELSARSFCKVSQKTVQLSEDLIDNSSNKKSSRSSTQNKSTKLAPIILEKISEDSIASQQGQFVAPETEIPPCESPPKLKSNSNVQLSTPQIMEKVADDINDLLHQNSEQELIVDPPKEFEDQNQPSLPGEEMCSEFREEQKVSLRKSGDHIELRNKKDERSKNQDDYLKTVREVQRNNKRRKKRKTKRILYNRNIPEDSEMESNTESIVIRRSSNLLALDNQNKANQSSRRTSNEKTSKVRRSINFSTIDPPTQFEDTYPGQNIRQITSPTTRRTRSGKIASPVNKRKSRLSVHQEESMHLNINSPNIEQSPMSKTPRNQERSSRKHSVACSPISPSRLNEIKDCQLAAHQEESLHLNKNSYNVEQSPMTKTPKNHQRSTRKHSVACSPISQSRLNEINDCQLAANRSVACSPMSQSKVPQSPLPCRNHSIGCSPMKRAKSQTQEISPTKNKKGIDKKTKNKKKDKIKEADLEPAPIVSDLIQEPSAPLEEPVKETKKKKGSRKKELDEIKTKTNEVNEEIEKRPRRNRKPPGAYWVHGQRDYLEVPTYTPVIVNKKTKTKSKKSKENNSEKPLPAPELPKIKKSVAIPASKISEYSGSDNPGPSTLHDKEQERSSKSHKTKKNSSRPKKEPTRENEKKLKKKGNEKKSETVQPEVENPISIVVEKSEKAPETNVKENEVQTDGSNKNSFIFAVPEPIKTKHTKTKEPKNDSKRKKNNLSLAKPISSTPNSTQPNALDHSSILNFSRQKDMNGIFDQLKTLSAIPNSSAISTVSSSSGPSCSSSSSDELNWINKLKNQSGNGVKGSNKSQEITSIAGLVFHEDKDKVEYAYYNTGEFKRIGYIRLQSKVNKKMCRAKQFNLDFVVMNGEVTFIINNERKICRDGDLCYVAKDSKYEIRNDSPATAMLMIVKPE